jgi:protein-tyrosine phosphatase
MAGASALPVTVLAVCTANISRSPAVERLLRSGFAAAGVASVQVGSAGVAALVGEPIDPPVAGFLLANGAEISGFASRQVTEPMVRSSELVLALTRAHRSQVLELVPSAVRRSFTLLEFARILESLDLSGLPAGLGADERLRAILPLATAGRSLAPRATSGGDDVLDPFGRGDATYERSLALIRQATDTIVRIVAG